MFKKILIAGVVLTATACQTYERLPLDPEAHATEWQQRKPEGAKDFAAKLSQRDATKRTKFNPANGVELSEAEAIALFFNPDLRVARMNAGAALMTADETGHWGNPEVSFDAMWMVNAKDSPWVLGAGISYTFPFSGRLGVEEDRAYAIADVRKREVIREEWRVVTSLRETWAELALVESKLEILRDHRKEIQATSKIAKLLDESGTITHADARVFEIALARLEAWETKLAGERETLQLAVLERMGLHPNAPVRLKPKLAWAAPKGDLEKQLRDRNPELSVVVSEYEVAEQSLRLEIRKQYPDVTIGGGYELEGGQSKIGLGFGLPIPIINLNQEGIARARGERLAAKAKVEAVTERLIHALSRAKTQVSVAQRHRKYLAETLAPLVDTQLADVRAQAELGEFDALLLLDALNTQFETKVEILDSRFDEVLAVERVRALLGPTYRQPETTHEED